MYYSLKYFYLPNVSIKNFVEDIFEGIEYKERVTINTIQIYKSFTYLKRK